MGNCECNNFDLHFQEIQLFSKKRSNSETKNLQHRNSPRKDTGDKKESPFKDETNTQTNK